jgi:hypothetical protein
MEHTELMRKMIGWKIAYIGIINSITGIGITLTLWNLIVYDIFSIALILGLITCHLALIIFFEDLIAVQAKIKKKY